MLLSFSTFIVSAICVLAPRTLKAAAQSPANAPIAINRTLWTVNADSFQPGNEPVNVLDDNAGTIWHTEWTPVLEPLPHNITINMQNRYMVNGFSYLPRQDGSPHGNVGQHTIQLSIDGITWTTVATGTWLNDQTVKTSFWAAVPAQYVRLNAMTEAEGTGQQWTSAAELNVLTNPHSTLSRQNWAVYADSQEGGANYYDAFEAIDDSPTTYWHTEYSPATAPFPHYFAIDQGSAFAVGGLTYLCRPPSTGANGRIGNYSIQYSQDNSTWTTITTGTWPDSQYLQTVEFAAVSARYFRLNSFTEAGNRGPWSSASEINLLDGSTQINDFKVTVDSQETAAANNSGILALDSDLNTFWHTSYSGNTVPGFPHYIIIDMGALFPVHSLTYTPRQDGILNGNIGGHEIDLSSDGSTWTKVESGAFFDDATAKLVNFEETVARYVRLTATSEAGNRGPWTSAAEVTLGFDTSYTPPPTTMGQWGQVINFPVVPVAAALIYNPPSILVWSSWSGDTFSNGPGGETATAIYNLGTGLISQAEITNIQHDMFCPGLSMDFNGQPFVTGGNDAPKTSYYDPPSNAWSSAQNMNIPRGYQASATTSNGNIFTIGGSWSGSYSGPKNGEVFNFTSGNWTLTPGCLVDPMLTADLQGTYRADNHAALFGWSSGTVFQAGPSHNMNWYTPTGYGGILSAGTRGNDPDAMNGNFVMYDTMAGAILAVGGATSYQDVPATTNTHIITIGAPNTTASVIQTASMSYARSFANGIVLPDGSVFVVGGQEFPNPFYDDEAIFSPELWSPVTQTWSIMAPMANPRCYHSVALLLPDATVFSGGGGLCAGCSQNHFDGQIFTPPYLFNSNGSPATRPVISSVSRSSVAVGNTLTITTGGAVSSFSIIRMGTATHTVDTDQRRISLTAISLGTNQYSVTIPSDPGKALPGYWLLFVLNAAGVPSLAQTIHITLS